MNASIHGHEVMKKMLESKDPFTAESLEKAIRGWFGPDARFHTCSAENMTAAELVSFLSARNKFVGSAAGFGMRRENICDHE
jgi:probable metal-binding protein